MGKQMTNSDGSTAADILNAALGHMQDRAATYDKPEGERSMGATVDAFAAVTGVFMTEEQGWLFMALLKAVRSQQGAYRADSYEDGAAYFALAGEAAVRDRTVKESLTVHPVHPATFDHIDPADVEISEQPDKPGFAELLSDFRHKADAGMQEVIDKALEEERVSLVQRLEGEGFRLIERINAGIADAMQAHEDMSDWRNWKEGDLLEMVKASDWEGMTNGKLYEFAAPENRDNFAVVDDNGELRSFHIGSDDFVSGDFKWHSRPSA